MLDIKYQIDSELVSAAEIISRAESLDSSFAASDIKRTSIAARILREHGHVVEDAAPQIVDERLSAKIRARVPYHMQDGLIRYIERGVDPGDFLRELLEGKLRAFFRADQSNRDAILEWIAFLYNDMPGIAWGTEERVANWMAARQSDHKQREAE